jgi:hypothetical protein
MQDISRPKFPGYPLLLLLLGLISIEAYISHVPGGYPESAIRPPNRDGTITGKDPQPSVPLLTLSWYPHSNSSEPAEGHSVLWLSKL